MKVAVSPHLSAPAYLIEMCNAQTHALCAGDGKCVEFFCDRWFGGAVGASTTYVGKCAHCLPYPVPPFLLPIQKCNVWDTGVHLAQLSKAIRC